MECKKKKQQVIRKHPHVTKDGGIYVRVSYFMKKYGWQLGQVFKITVGNGTIELRPFPESRSCLYEANLCKVNCILIGRQYVEKAGFKPKDPFAVKEENGVLKILKVEKVPEIEKKQVKSCLI